MAVTLRCQHFTLEERQEISAWLQQNQSKAAMARHLGRSPSSIGREISRHRVCTYEGALV